jgi:hypothetical protein
LERIASLEAKMSALQAAAPTAQPPAAPGPAAAPGLPAPPPPVPPQAAVRAGAEGAGGPGGAFPDALANGPREPAGVCTRTLVSSLNAPAGSGRPRGGRERPR